MSSPIYWVDATSHLSRICPVMRKLIATYQGEALQCRGDAFYTLARSIVGQQISVKAADSVWAKLEYGSGKADASLSLGERGRVRGIHPEMILSLSDTDLRACGLSGQKVIYLRAIANYFTTNQIQQGYFDGLDDAEVIRQLVAIKGIGTWTAEMFLMFHLMRPDVFPVDDIGLQKGMMRHYDGFNPLSLPSSPRKRGSSPMNAKEYDVPEKTRKKQLYAKMLHMAEPWRPYRSVATWYLWRALDPVPVAY